MLVKNELECYLKSCRIFRSQAGCIAMQLPLYIQYIHIYIYIIKPLRGDRMHLVRLLVSLIISSVIFHLDLIIYSVQYARAL